MKPKDSSDLYSLLEHVRQRPYMYLRRKSLLEIQTICHGYKAALQTHSIEEPGASFSSDFGDYLAKRFGWSTCKGWACAIRDHTRGSGLAFERFFVLLHEFRNQKANKVPAADASRG